VQTSPFAQRQGWIECGATFIPETQKIYMLAPIYPTKIWVICICSSQYQSENITTCAITNDKKKQRIQYHNHVLSG
jgi:hypothetical protein